MTLRAPFPWFGGKRLAAHLVWERFGDVRNYVEPFFGSGAVLLGRPHPPGVETVNDADCYLANFWRAVQHDPAAVAAHADWPVNEACLHARHAWLVARADFRERMMTDPEYHDPKVAGWWVWGLSAWIGSGWCDWRRRQAGVHNDNRRPHVTDSGTGVHRQLPLVHGDGGMGVHGHRVGRKRPHLTGAGGGIGTHSTNRYDGLEAWFAALQTRLRRVRVCCGDWRRVTGPSVVFPASGRAGVFLDPPYPGEADRHSEIYAAEDLDVAHDVHAWALEHGDDPRLRVAFCGYEGTHEFPDSWECVPWKATGGYGNRPGLRGAENAERERIWFSPHCLHADFANTPLGATLAGGLP